jgi:hypothetical protein
MKVNMLVKKNDDTEAERGISGSNPRIAVSKNNSLDLEKPFYTPVAFDRRSC